MVFPSSGPSFTSSTSSSSSSLSSLSSRKKLTAMKTIEQQQQTRVHASQKKRVPVRPSLCFNFDDDEDDHRLEQQRGGGGDHFANEDSGFEEVPLVGLETFASSVYSASSKISKKKQAKLASIEAKADEIRAASVASTRRMLAYCGQANEAGVRTMEMLATQGDQLHRVDGQLDQMAGNLGQARKNIREMERGFSSALLSDLCCFQRCFSSSAQGEGEPSNGSAEVDSSSSSSSWFGESFSNLVGNWKQQPQPQSQLISSQPKPAQIKTISGSNKTENNSVFPRSCEGAYREVHGGGVYSFEVRANNHYHHLESELSDNLVGVEHLLGGLRNMALDMDAEINRQNLQLDGIHRKTEDNSVALGRAAVAVNKLIEE